MHDRKKNVMQPGEYAFNLSDFALFLAVMKDKEAYECMLSIILDEDDLELVEVAVENVVLNDLGKRAIRLDAVAVDRKQRQFDTEMQNSIHADDIRRRARFYQGLMDSPLLKSGRHTRYKNLPSSVIIFITQEDLFGLDRAMYTFTERCHEEPGLELGDETMKIFLNMKSFNGREELVSLLQYMKKTTLDNPGITVKDKRILRLDEIVTEVKQSEEWEAISMDFWEVAKQQGEMLGEEKGRKAGEEIGRKAGEEIGRKAGEESGIRKMIEVFQELGVGKETALEKIQEKFQLQQQDATMYVEQYWN